MPLRLFNTLSGQVDELFAMDGKPCACTPAAPLSTITATSATRTFLQIDILRRTLALLSIPVRHVMNITDVDDKIIRNAAARAFLLPSTQPPSNKPSLKISKPSRSSA